MDFTDRDYVGFWPRVLATLIDTLVFSLLMAPFADRLLDVDLSRFNPEQFNPDEIDAHNPLQLSLLLQSMDPWSWVAMAVGVLLFWLARQATPGKMVIRARIVDATTGGKPTALQLLLRYLGYYVSMFALFLGFIWVAFDARKQGWHDKMASTVVVRDRRSNDKVRSG